MTEDIRREIREQQGKQYGVEIHRQKGAAPGAVEGAPSEE
jgi:hypothetical protein